MTIIKVIYDDGNNSLLKLQRQAKKQRKKLSNMKTTEIINSLFGQYR